jgi:hypothetical protein
VPEPFAGMVVVPPVINKSARAAFVSRTAAATPATIKRQDTPHRMTAPVLSQMNSAEGAGNHFTSCKNNAISVLRVHTISYLIIPK